MVSGKLGVKSVSTIDISAILWCVLTLLLLLLKRGSSTPFLDSFVCPVDLDISAQWQTLSPAQWQSHALHNETLISVETQRCCNSNRKNEAGSAAFKRSRRT